MLSRSKSASGSESATGLWVEFTGDYRWDPVTLLPLLCLLKTCLIIWLILPVLFSALSTVRGGVRCYQSHNLEKADPSCDKPELLDLICFCCMYDIVAKLWRDLLGINNKQEVFLSLHLLHQFLALLPFPHLCLSFQKPDKRRICTHRAAAAS